MPDSKNLIIINENMLEFDASSYLPGSPIPPVVFYKIIASGKAKVHTQTICVDGDEKTVIRVNPYNTPAFPVPGAGIFKISKLNDDQKTKKTKHNGKAIIIQGSEFDSEYTISVKSNLPTPKGPEQDTKTDYKGKGKFINLPNTTVYAG